MGHFQRITDGKRSGFFGEERTVVSHAESVKSFSAVRTTASTLPVTSPILLIHNGMGTIEELQNPAADVDGTVTHAARRDGNIIITSTLTVLRILARRAARRRLQLSRRYPAGVLPDVAGITISAQRCGANWRSTVFINPLTALELPGIDELRHHTDEINAICEGSPP